MKQPFSPDYNEKSVACPNCGSENTQNITMDFDDELGAPEYTEYICNNCGTKFIPAMESTNIRAWSKKVRINGNNLGKSWRD